MEVFTLEQRIDNMLKAIEINYVNDTHMRLKSKVKIYTTSLIYKAKTDENCKMLLEKVKQSHYLEVLDINYEKLERFINEN